jgi:hypothetical protein
MLEILIRSTGERIYVMRKKLNRSLPALLDTSQANVLFAHLPPHSKHASEDYFIKPVAARPISRPTRFNSYVKDVKVKQQTKTKNARHKINHS